MPNYELYRDDIETIAENEGETHAKIIEVMTEGTHKVQEKYGRDVRISHAKAHALLKGQLVVRGDLPPELAQGLFATPGTYDVLIRMASAPGELLDDSKVNAARGMAIKVLNVQGPKLAGYNGNAQDFVLAPGKEFIAGDAKAFLGAFKPNAELAPKLSDTTKGIVSDVARVTNEALTAVGLKSSKLDFFGHPKVHPLGEAQYSQAALRHGEYVAKLGVIPDTPALTELLDREIELKSPEALREASVAFFKSNPAEYSVRVQLNTDLKTMPIEDATAPWAEDASEYREVARIIIPAQTAWDGAKDTYFEDLSFSPAHSLAAHRPLGSVNRARLAVYGVMSDLRHRENSRPEIEPAGSAEVAS